MNFINLSKKIKPEFERNLANLFRQKKPLSPSLNTAMAYSVLNGGKRIRPMLVFATLDGFKKKLSLGTQAAIAVELIHCYSLIHDDLPAMDDDDLRRNQPTCHIKFNEYTAILAGDALQTLAFSELCKSKNALELVKILAKSAGADGMVGGQMLDMQASDTQAIKSKQLLQIHKNKTAALLKACVLMGASLAQATPKQTKNLAKFAEKIGLAFQIQDDILDLTSTTKELGKKTSADLEQHKASYVNVFGLDKSKQKVQQLIDSSLSILDKLASESSPKLEFKALKDFALYIIDRKK